MNAKELRAKLSALLSEEIGKYKNGVDSIWVYGGGSNPPSSSDGLEVLISASPLGDPQSCSGGVRYHPKYWEITLKNWAMSGKLAEAVSKIQGNFIAKRYSHYPANEEVLEQGRLYIFDPTMLPPRSVIYIPQTPEVTDETEWIY